MAGETPITLIGNVVDDPELKFLSSGVAVSKFRMASTPRQLDKASGEWRDGEPLFMSCTVWRQMAENVCESLQRGTRVVVTGRLRQRSYETQAGEKRVVFEVEVDEVGPSLRYATVKVNRMQRSGGDGRAVDNANDQFATAPPPERTPASSGGSSFDDSPPF